MPEQFPAHPANVEPAAGAAESWTAVPDENSALQLDPQLMPEGVLVTVPVPVPERVTLSLGGGGGGGLLSLLEPPPHPTRAISAITALAAKANRVFLKFIEVLRYRDAGEMAKKGPPLSRVKE